MKVAEAAGRALSTGLNAIVKQYDLPLNFSPEVLESANRVTRRWKTQSASWATNRFDATHLPMVTLDPASSTDLDQAFAVRKQGDDIVLSYAIADVSAFVEIGDPIEQEAWERGVTIYGLTEKIPLYPKILSQDCASLLPDGPRPVVLFEVTMNIHGHAKLRSVKRAIVQSREKLAYDRFDVSSVPHLEEFANRMWVDEMRRGAFRVEFPQQEVIADESSPGGVRLSLRARTYPELVNSTLSLATNIAVGERLRVSGIGLFRVMDEPSPHALEMLRREAHAIGIQWKVDESLRQLQQRLVPDNVTHQRFLLEASRAGGRARYATFNPALVPWHSAIGATYAHATAPLRRLADRYVIDLIHLINNDLPVPDSLLVKLEQLPDVMARCEAKAANVDRAVIDLLEAISLQHRIGEVLVAEVIDANVGIVQTTDSAIRAKATELHGVINGDMVRVRIEVADPTTRTVRLVAVAK